MMIREKVDSSIVCNSDLHMMYDVNNTTYVLDSNKVCACHVDTEE